MTSREILYNGVSRAAWSYFFLYFDIRPGSLNILPSFAAYLLFLSAIKLLKEERQDLELLRPLGIFLMLWNLTDWLLAYPAEWFGEIWSHATVILAAVYLIAGLCLMLALFALRRLLRERAPEPPQTV